MMDPRNPDQPVPGLGAGDVGAVYPEQRVEAGQRHGYVGNVETYAIPLPGHTNVVTPAGTAAEIGARRAAVQADDARIDGDVVGDPDTSKAAGVASIVTHEDTGDDGPPVETIGEPVRHSRTTSAAEKAAAKAGRK